uniref:Tissue factor pathway inhibitor n=1 Tax=Malurus cyaneus samueli TaxID=2593467 RepID=A0A8C5X7G9_9PASS
MLCGASLAEHTSNLILELHSVVCSKLTALPPLKLGHSFCAMKADDGPCKAIHIRYFFNIKSRKCEEFEYGGCHGNKNNFLTREECQKTCVVTGQCPFFYPPTTLFPEKPDFCFHDQEPGICRGYFTRYFYNKETKLCEAFKYGGCLGNQNNFRSLEECQNICEDSCNVVSHLAFLALPEPRPIPSLCLTPMDRGLCRAKELRFFFNYSTGRCRPFSYSGCGGNENNFVSRKSCLRICRKGFNKKKGERRLIRIKKKRKKQPVKALGEEVTPERMQV